LLEVGPGSTLTRLAALCKPGLETVTSLPEAKSAQSAARVVADAAATLWQVGIALDWSACHNHGPKRVNLPGYPFENKRFWIDPDMDRAAAVKSGPVRAEIGRSFYAPAWTRTSPPMSVAAAEPLHWLVFRDDSGLAEVVAGILVTQGHRVTHVDRGDVYEAADGHFKLPVQREGFTQLLAALAQQEQLPDYILYAWTWDPEPDATRAFYGPLYLAAALGETHRTKFIAWTSVTRTALAVTGAEDLNPVNALCSGMIQTVPGEIQGLITRQIDLDPATEPAILAEHLLLECGAPLEDQLVAWRGSTRWTRTFQRILPDRPMQLGRTLKQGGTYLITGGLGGIGLTLATFLAQTLKANLVLLGRTALPDPNQWQDLLAAKNGDPRLITKIQAVRAMQETGSQVLLHAADVTDREAMEHLKTLIESKFGKLDGLIHAAGVAGGGAIQLKTREIAEPVLGPKVEGTLNLARVFGPSLDFTVLCSSLASLFSPAGQCDYCAANAFLDSFAHQRQALGERVIAINWDTWREIGMAVETDVPDDMEAMRQYYLSQGLSNGEGAFAFERILAQELPQVAVCTKELPEIILERARPRLNPGETQQKTQVQRHPRPDVGEYLPPENEDQEKMVAIWCELLGLEMVGTADDFLALGGHSLLAIQLLARYRAEFEVQVTVAEFFEQPTIKALSERLQQPRKVSKVPTLKRVARDRYRTRSTDNDRKEPSDDRE
jgi:acyl transferase domain-containing protein/aryl carrier-like protein